MNRLSFVFVAIGCSLASCHSASTKSETFLDSLITAQIQVVGEACSSINKLVIVNGHAESLEIPGDSIRWENELDLYRKLASFERPAHLKKYKMQEGIKDQSSNLLIRRFTTTEYSDMPEVLFFYLKTPKNLKKIEAVFYEGNILYKSEKKLTLEFDALRHPFILTAYSLKGYEKMVLGDSVTFAVYSHIVYPFQN